MDAFDPADPALPSPSASTPAQLDEAMTARLPRYLIGLHGSGGESEMLDARKPGWVVVSIQVNPPDSTGDFTSLSELGLGVIVVLNNGSGAAGTIPSSIRYSEFAHQCAEFVADSKGARLWVIGQAPNSANARPKSESSTDAGAEIITPEMYARCFNLCRAAIRGIPGHGEDWVIPAAVATFNTDTTYPANPTGDWVRYFADTLFQIVLQGGDVDALSLQLHTHGAGAGYVSSDARGPGKLGNRSWHLRSYRDYIAAVSLPLRTRPVFVTAACPLEPGWEPGASAWIQAAGAEIQAWNDEPAAQPIQALCFYRWKSLPDDPPGLGISEQPGVIEDLRSALQQDYRVRWPGLPPAAEYGVEWIESLLAPDHILKTSEQFSGTVTVRNTGALPWLMMGADSVCLRSRWLDHEGNELAADWAPGAGRVDLARDVAAGQNVTIEQVEITTPKVDGLYRLRLDLERGEGGWLGGLSDHPLDLVLRVQAPGFAVEWLAVVTPEDSRMTKGSVLAGPVRARNVGADNWEQEGSNRVSLRYTWLDEGLQVVLPEAAVTEYTLPAAVPPGEAAEFGAVLLTAPAREGKYTLRWELAGDSGISAHSEVVNVVPPRPAFDAAWAEPAGLTHRLEPNESVVISLAITNSGSTSWEAAGDEVARIVYEWQRSPGEPVGEEYRGELLVPYEVLPEATLRVERLGLRAPLEPGPYLVLFSLERGTVDRRTFEWEVSIGTDAPDERAEWIETVPLPQPAMTTGSRVAGQVVVRNAGGRKWTASGDRETRLGYIWLGLEGQPLENESRTWPLGHDLLPREQATCEVELIAPASAGEYFLRWDLFRAGEPLGVGRETRVEVREPAQDWAGRVVAHNTPANVRAGQSFEVSLSVKNVGSCAWPGWSRAMIAARWLDAAAAPMKEPQPVFWLVEPALEPEEERDIRLELVTPPLAGVYSLVYALDLPPRPNEETPDVVSKRDPGMIGLDGPRTDEIKLGSIRGELPLRVRVTDEDFPTNLWRAMASHNAVEAFFAIDGNTATTWSSLERQAPGMWFRLDLGETRVVDGLALRSQGTGHPAAYRTMLSTDGLTWRPVAEVRRADDRDALLDWTPQPARFIKVELLAPSPEPWLISQVQVHAGELWAATASVNNEKAPRALAEDPDDAWTTAELGQRENLWFQLDLGREEWVSGMVLLAPGLENPLSFRLTAWIEPAGAWQTTAEETDAGIPVDLSFAPVLTRYLHIQLLEAGSRPWGICAIRIKRQMTHWVANW